MNNEIESAASRGDIKYLVEVIYGDQFDSRAAAIDAIAGVGGVKARKALLGAARDRSRIRPELRLRALESLQGICDRADYLSILDEFLSGDNRKVVAGARRMFKDIDPLEFPKRLLVKGCLDHQAISTYGRFREAGALPLLDRFVRERIEAGEVTATPYWGKVYAAVKALGKIGGEDAARTLKDIERRLQTRRRKQGFLHDERTEKLEHAVEVSLGAVGKE